MGVLRPSGLLLLFSRSGGLLGSVSSLVGSLGGFLGSVGGVAGTGGTGSIGSAAAHVVSRSRTPVLLAS